MPLVNVHMATGRSPEQKKALLTAITDAMEEHLGTPRESVRVWISEFPPTDYMAAGELLVDKQARLAGEVRRD
ncbi:MAG: 4-oxalocrotonate tautomerase family protein [Actinobacteria bacterium]|nr:4-oxalocrotonate tautomerase family protein [Actinomycetota bacterium]